MKKQSRQCAAIATGPDTGSDADGDSDAVAATVRKRCRAVVVGLLTLVLCACSVLEPSATPPPAFYALNAPPDVLLPNAGAGGAAPAETATQASGTKLLPVTLIVNPPRAAAGFDSQRIIYLRQAHKLEYFANSEWVDPPARMLGTLLVSALQATGNFRAVVLAPGTAVGELRLETEVIRLQQDFQIRPSRAHFTLRATLLDERTRRVLAWREFDATAPAPSDDPPGTVAAANRAVQSVLKELAAFCAVQAGQYPETPIRQK
jgi:cholesterol transport system auxiliary component